MRYRAGGRSPVWRLSGQPRWRGPVGLGLVQGPQDPPI